MCSCLHTTAAPWVFYLRFCLATIVAGLFVAVGSVSLFRWWSRSSDDKHFRALLRGDTQDTIARVDVVGRQTDVSGEHFILDDRASLDFLAKALANATYGSFAKDATSSYQGRVWFASGDHIDVRVSWFNMADDGMEVGYIWSDWLYEEESLYRVAFPDAPPARLRGLLEGL